MKRIGIDCRFASTPSGLGRYTRELVTHLLKKENGIEYTLFVRSENEPWLPHPRRGAAENCKLSKTLSLPNGKIVNFSHYSLREQISFPRMIADSNIDLFFSPHFNVPLRCPVPFIVTIHDLILHAYPHEAPLWKRLAYRWQMRHAIRNSAHIIAVSQYTADEIRKRYSLPPLSGSLPVGERTLNPLSRRGAVRVRGYEDQEHHQNKISVIYEGVSPLFSPRPEHEQKEICKKYHIQPPFFLYVGSNKNHKNVGLLKQAAERAGGRLLCVPESTGNIPDDDLPALYCAATALVTASLAEGFCLPACEALACGCPVIATHRGAIPEVTQGHALLIDPTVDAFVHALQSPPHRPNPIRLYDWEDAAEKTAILFLAMLERWQKR